MNSALLRSLLGGSSHASQLHLTPPPIANLVSTPHSLLISSPANLHLYPTHMICTTQKPLSLRPLNRRPALLLRPGIGVGGGVLFENLGVGGIL